MRNLVMMLSAAALAIPATMAVPTSKAEARKHHYSSRSYRHVRRCRHSSGTTGLVAGGVGGALVGQSVARPRAARHRGGRSRRGVRGSRDRSDDHRQAALPLTRRGVVGTG